MAQTEAQKRASRKYEARTHNTARLAKLSYDRALIPFRKDVALNADVVKDYALSHGESVNGFLLRAIRETIEHDTRGATDGQ